MVWLYTLLLVGFVAVLILHMAVNFIFTVA